MVDIKAYAKNFVMSALGFVCLFALALTFLSPKSGISQESSITSQRLIPSQGVVLIYHRFGEGEFPSTNTKIEQLDAHIAELLTPEKYNTVSLPSMVENLKQGVGYDKRTVAITVDDAFKSVFTNAWPRLKEAGIPLTIFVATDTIDNNSSHYMSWEQLRELAEGGVTIAHHGASHKHYLDMSDEEILADLNKASSRFVAELGFQPTIFAYPYGEYDDRIKALLTQAGIEVAFNQLSGPLPETSDMLSLPRFPINERYGDIGRFKLITGTVPLAIEQVIPSEPTIDPENNPPVYGFTITNPPANLNALACYPSHLGKAADITILNEKRVEVRFDKPFPKGRNKINCTLPAGDGRWYWLGGLFIVSE
ncbi:MAG: polysaccharide deacetylase family protein [Sphingomonadales bacterium]|nr:polysaccharide deacetylase family protein [Sphingomonadales bacterium]